MVAPRGTIAVSGGDGGITSFSLSTSIYSPWSLFLRGLLDGYAGSIDAINPLP